MNRPREYDREEIEEKLLAWSLLDTSFNLCAFCGEVPIAPTMLIGWTKTDKEFSKSYEIVKARIGQRREQGLNKGLVHVKAYDLNAVNYDPFIKDSRRAEMEYEMSLKTAADSKQNIEVSIVDYSRAEEGSNPSLSIPTA